MMEVTLVVAMVVLVPILNEISQANWRAKSSGLIHDTIY